MLIHYYSRSQLERQTTVTNIEEILSDTAKMSFEMCSKRNRVLIQIIQDMMKRNQTTLFLVFTGPTKASD